MGFSAKLIHDFYLILDNSIIAKKVISDNRLCPTLKVSDDVEILTILCNKTHLSFCKWILVSWHNLWESAKMILRVKILEILNDRWSWNEKLTNNIRHRSLFNQFLGNFLINDTRNLVIFLDKRSLSNRHFWAMIEPETELFKEDSSRHAIRFKARNSRRFWKSYFFIWFLQTRQGGGT